MALREGSRVFLRFDSPSRGRLLQPGLVGKIWDGGWTLAFETRHHAVETGEEKLVYYDRARNFVQQPVLVEAQSSEGPPFVLTLKSIGDAVSVETRKEDRVSTSGTGLTATLEDEDGCLIQNVSLSGLAVISTRKYHVGRCLEIAIRYGDEEYVGPVEIRCVNALDGGKTRYGLLGVFDTAEGRDLQNGLTRMTLEIQQQHLKRISGSS
ncbi:MAG: PilZ domain-containing protein [Myxococcales bacterium]|nr:PilZ domain-containing protein [Myxococcales bacterium]